MSGARSYHDPCGIARALDVIGDRWALLVVRELTFGPKRFVQLAGGLPGVSPNVLSQRLRDLEAAGVVDRELLPLPAGVPVYRLTSRGRALEPVLLELGRWGSQLPQASDRELTASALLVALKTVFDPSAQAASADATYSIRIDGDWYRLTISRQSIDIGPGPADRPAATFQTDVGTLRAVAFGRERLADAERAGRLTVSGDRSAADRFAGLFRPPPQRGPEPATAIETSVSRQT